MADENAIDQIIALMTEGAPEAPRVDPVDINLRSGVTFVFRDPQKRGVPADRQGAIRRGMADGWLVGAFLVEWGYDVPQPLIPQFEAWLEANEAGFSAHQPDGVHYRGTYAVFSTSEKKSGAYRTLWAFDSFNGMQDFGFRLADRNTPFTRLVTDLLAFFDRDYNAGTSQQIYLPAQGTSNLAGLGQPRVAPPNVP